MTSETTEIAGGNRRIIFLMHGGLIVVAAIYWIVLAGINAPFVYHPDEPDVMARAVRIAITGDLNPHWFHYPTLTIYLHAIVAKILQPFLGFQMERAASMVVQGAEPDVFPLYYAARFVTIGFSIGTLLLLLRLTSRLSTPLIASLAGLMFVGSPLVRQSAAYITLEMPVTSFVLASLASMVRFVDSAQDDTPKERYLWYAVVLGGLAAGTKYNGAAILFLVPVAMWAAGMGFRWSLQRLPAAVVLSIVVFIATTPYSVLDMKTFLDTEIGMAYDFVHYSTGHPGADEGISLFKAIGDIFVRHSILAVFALLAPFAARDRSIRKPILLVALVPLTFLAIIGMAKVYFERHLTPLTPALDCLAAASLWSAMRSSMASESRIQKTLGAIVPLAIAFTIAGASLFRTLSDTRNEIEVTDNRTLAYEWITANIPPNSSLLQDPLCLDDQPASFRGHCAQLRLCRSQRITVAKIRHTALQKLRSAF
jgi:4-amino-4-deoxy-L-arabinose transferase-like glycosyltransferase